MKINPNGFREYDARWLYEKDIDLDGITNLGKGFGTQIINHTKKTNPRIIVGHDYRSYSEDIKKSLIEKPEDYDSKPSIEDVAKILAKSFINGKCDNFENSAIYIVRGNDGVGKTLFTKKLKTLFETKIDAKSCTIFEKSNVKKSLTEITSWFSKNKSDIFIVCYTNSGRVNDINHTDR